MRDLIEPPSYKWQKTAFYLSLALNALFFLLLVALLFQQPFGLSFHFQVSERPLKIFVTNYEELKKIDDMSLETLIATLQDKTLIEQGYRRRDLAVAILSSRHFDLKRALGREPTCRELAREDGSPFFVYPGLDDTDFSHIICFLQEEKWPFTMAGLLQAMRRRGFTDESLNAAVAQTAEFLLIERLFANQRIPISQNMLFSLLIDGGATVLAEYFDAQKKALDLSEMARREFLLHYVARSHSKVAAALFLRTDFHYALNQLEDEGVIQLLEHVPPRSRVALIFAKKLLSSMRSDHVHLRARALLISAKTNNMELVTSEKVATLLPKLSAPQDKSEPKKTVRPNLLVHPLQPHVEANTKKAVPCLPIVKSKISERLHIVQAKETLWGISRKYAISAKKLAEYNRLTSDRLSPGQTLRIPAKTSS